MRRKFGRPAEKTYRGPAAYLHFAGAEKQEEFLQHSTARTHLTTCYKTCAARTRFLSKPYLSECEAKQFEDECTPASAQGLRTLHSPASRDRPGARGRLVGVARACARRRLGREGAAGEVVSRGRQPRLEGALRRA